MQIPQYQIVKWIRIHYILYRVKNLITMRHFYYVTITYKNQMMIVDQIVNFEISSISFTAFWCLSLEITFTKTKMLPTK